MARRTERRISTASKRSPSATGIRKMLTITTATKARRVPSRHPRPMGWLNLFNLRHESSSGAWTKNSTADTRRVGTRVSGLTFGLSVGICGVRCPALPRARETNPPPHRHRSPRQARSQKASAAASPRPSCRPAHETSGVEPPVPGWEHHQLLPAVASSLPTTPESTRRDARPRIAFPRSVFS
jgi:hypothetical protein